MDDADIRNWLGLIALWALALAAVLIGAALAVDARHALRLLH